MSDCIFCKIIAGEIPSKKVYEDDMLLAFWDVAPKAPVHLLVIPKVHIKNLYELNETNAAYAHAMITKAPEIAKQAGLAEGFRLIANTGEACGQTVHHMHFHILGRFNESGDTGFPGEDS